MTAPSQLYAGGRLTAALLRGVAPLSAYKSLDQTVSTGVGTLQADDALLLPVTAGAVYLFVLSATYSGGALGSSDLLTGWSVPTGATMDYGRLGNDTSGALIFDKTIQSDQVAFGTSGSGTNSLLLVGTAVISSTAGTLQWEWCQNSGTATATTVHAGSVLAAWQVQ